MPDQSNSNNNEEEEEEKTLPPISDHKLNEILLPALSSTPKP